VLSVHTSPLAQPGTGDAGGMNVYVLQSALQMARRGVEVEIFTRATSSADQPVVKVAPGVLVRNVVAGPFEGLDKYDLPTQLCAFTAGVLRAEATHEPGYYDIVHSHYWLSGQVGWLARDRWAVPLVHTAHTLAAVKNAALADGDSPEPPLRAVGEQQVVDEADRLIVNTEHEAAQLVSMWCIPASTWRCSPPVTNVPRAPRSASTPMNRCSRSSAASNPSRRPTCCCARRPNCPACGSWWPVDRRAAGWLHRTGWFGWPTNWVSPTG
jgi:glycosyltransferase involved in cell wall biosynthesis